MTDKQQCCERDHDHDGNCDIHSAPGVFRNGALNLTQTARDVRTKYELAQCRIDNLRIALGRIKDSGGITAEVAGVILAALAVDTRAAMVQWSRRDQLFVVNKRDLTTHVGQTFGPDDEYVLVTMAKT